MQGRQYKYYGGGQTIENTLYTTKRGKKTWNSDFTNNVKIFQMKSTFIHQDYLQQIFAI